MAAVNAVAILKSCMKSLLSGGNTTKESGLVGSCVVLVRHTEDLNTLDDTKDLID